MDSVSDKFIDQAIEHESNSSHPYDVKVKMALTELRERREAEHGVVKFQWKCPCGYVNVWSWPMVEYCKLVPTMMECDKCKQETMMHTRPEVIHDALRRDGDKK